MKSYKRKVVYQDDQLEVVICVWPPGSESKFHDHGRSEGIVFVTEGAVSNIVYDKKTGMKKIGSIRGPGMILETPTMIHKMMNIDDKETAMTVHIYLPPLKMRYYTEKELESPH